MGITKKIDFSEVILPKHFCERYMVRVLKVTETIPLNIIREIILIDLQSRMTDIEKECFELLFMNGEVGLTLEHVYQMRIRNGVLITVKPRAL